MKEVQCDMCKDRKWITLEPNPVDKTTHLWAPCLGCSGGRKLADIENERHVKIQRAPNGDFYEQGVN